MQRSDAKIPAPGDLTPEALLTPEREKEAVMGMAETKEPRTLPTPSTSSS